MAPRGKDFQIEGACQNMLANLTGMICDGAKETCSFKLATSAEVAVISAYLAMENVIAKPNTGIIGNTIEDTIKKSRHFIERRVALYGFSNNKNIGGHIAVSLK